MTTRIDELNSRYLVPGIDLGTAAPAELGEFEEDFGDAPYSQLPTLTGIRSPTGWQDMFGLNRVAPSPSSIDPPPRPSSYARAGIANTASPSLQSQIPRNQSRAFESLKIGRMKDMLAAYDQTVRRIHARTTGGSR